MKKVGLCIQFNKVDNYGTVLQAYATIKSIASIGYEPRIIEYQKKYNLKFIFSQLPRIFEASNWTGTKRKKRIKKGLKNSKLFREYTESRKNSFKSFRNRRFRSDLIDTFVGYDSLKKGSSSYDAFLVGSDQLWLPSGVKTNFYNLMFVPNEIKKVSYSTSFGVSEIPKKQRKEYRIFLNRFSALGVREKSGVEIIKDLTNRDACLVCDPVMLLERKEWDAEIATFPSPVPYGNGEYVLSYILGDNMEARNFAKKMASRLNKKLVTIKFTEDYISFDEYYGDYSPKDVSPEQFIKLIKEAYCVVTDSFHGTAFSIIYEKDFYVFYRFANTYKYSKNTRIDNILAKFRLEDRLIKDINSYTDYERIDYSKIANVLSDWRKESLAFLKCSLDEDCSK